MNEYKKTDRLKEGCETVMKKQKETDPLKTGCVPLSSAWRNLDFYLQATDHILNVVLIIKDKQ